MPNLFLMLILLASPSIQKKIPNMVEVFTFKQYPDNKITAFIGDQPIQFKASIDLMNPNSCFVLNGYSDYNSSSLSIIKPHKELTFNKNKVIGKEIEDVFGVEDDNFGPLIKLRFDFIDNDPNLYYLNRVSLPFSFKDEAYSIVHQLKNKGFIKNLSFSRIRLNIVTYFYLGGIPDEYKGNQTIITHCNVIGRHGYWDCSLSEITINNNSKSYTYKSSPRSVIAFDFEKVFIYAPRNFIDFLFNSFFKEYIQNEDCHIDNNAFRRLSCKIDVWFKMGRMTFVIGDYIYTFDLEQFIKCSIGRCFLEIIDNPDGDYWRFGSYFFDTFDVLFDYEQKKIFFYTTKGVASYHNNQKTSNKLMYLVNSTIMLSAIVLMLFLKRVFKPIQS